MQCLSRAVSCWKLWFSIAVPKTHRLSAPHNTYSLLEEAHGSISLPHKDARTQPGDQDRMSEPEL
jgi:hypothetical protein